VWPDGIVMPAPTLDDDLSLAERVEAFSVEQLGIMEQAHQFRDWFWSLDSVFNEA